jgi:glycosyltransferase involved in cell wall biosynthesis
MPDLRPRVLLIAYHFGDGCETGGFRWNAMVAHLMERGWEFDVITLAREPAGQTPPADIDEIRGPLEVFPVREPTWPASLFHLPAKKLARALRWVRDRITPDRGRASVGSVSVQRNVTPENWPVVVGHRKVVKSRSRRIGADLAEIEAYLTQRAWSRAAERVGSRLIDRRRHGCVIVSSPPHYTQSVGHHLARKHGVPYIADFRDPFFFGLGDALEIVSPVGRWLRARAERAWVGSQHTVLHNTDVAKRVIAPLVGGGVEPRRLVVPNGFDTHDPQRRPRRDRFQVSYAGWLHPFMDIRPVIAGLARLKEKYEIPTDELAFTLMGVSDDFEGASIRGLAAAYSVEKVVQIVPRMPRQAAWDLMASSAVLVAFDCIHPLAVPSKFYEYTQMSGRPLLIGNVEGAMAEAGAQVGLEVHSPDDHDSVFRALEESFEIWRNDAFTGPTDPEGVFDRLHQSGQVAELLEEVIRSRGSDR